ncbi:hypothetical protein [Kordia sp.]|uniref:hypothetical protein n=1 Tax=Kordia sp. TaxID=1965332 RepID=UPI003B5CA70F
MGKTNLVIDEEQKKVFLNGEYVGDFSLGSFSGGDIYIKSENQLKLFNDTDIKIIDFFNIGVNSVNINFQRDGFPYFEDEFLNDILICFTKELDYFVHVRFHNEIFWKIPIATKDFFKKVNESLDNYELFEAYEEQLEDIVDVLTLGFFIYLNININIENISTMIQEIIKNLNNCIHSTLFEIEEENKANISNLSNTFTFPPEIQSSCEQYLIYFATFLKDIGINAETNIESKAHETLFTVIPKSGEEALDKIKEALQIYLHLPENPEFESAANEFTDMSVQKLASQVYFYKSQLALASTMLQMKDKQIESLNMTIYQQETSVALQVVEEENEEKILGGLVTITEFKFNGIKVNSPEMVRFLKRVFRRKE